MKLRWDCKHSHLSLCQLDQMYVDKKPGLDIAGLTDSQRQNIQAVLVLLEQSGQTEPAQAAQSKSILTAFHLIVSALDGEENCALLSLCLQSVEYNFEVGRKNAWSLIVPSAGKLSLKKKKISFPEVVFHAVNGSPSFRDETGFSCRLEKMQQPHSVTGPGATG